MEFIKYEEIWELVGIYWVFGMCEIRLLIFRDLD